MQGTFVSDDIDYFNDRLPENSAVSEVPISHYFLFQGANAYIVQEMHLHEPVVAMTAFSSNYMKM